MPCGSCRNIINLVANDTNPSLIIQITDKTTGGGFNLSPSDREVFLKFREEGSDVSLFEQPTTKQNGGFSGIVIMDWPTGGLNVPEGIYEGEIFIRTNGSIHTIYDIVKFNVRADFGAVQ